MLEGGGRERASACEVSFQAQGTGLPLVTPAQYSQVSTRILGMRTAPFPPSLINYPHPAWVYPKILVLTGGFQRVFQRASSSGEYIRKPGPPLTPKQLAVWAALWGHTVSDYGPRGGFY